MKELVTGLTEKRTPEGICVPRVHYTADPERRAPEWKERERRKYTSESAWQAEQEIVFGAGGGERLFAEILTRYAHKIIIDPEPSGFKPSPHWDYFGGFDSGKANPTAALAGIYGQPDLFRSLNFLQEPSAERRYFQCYCISVPRRGHRQPGAGARKQRTSWNGAHSSALDEPRPAGTDTQDIVSRAQPWVPPVDCRCVSSSADPVPRGSSTSPPSYYLAPVSAPPQDKPSLRLLRIPPLRSLVEKAAVGHGSLLSAQRLLNTQQQHGFDHKFKGVDGIDSSTNRRFGNRLYSDDERHPVLGHVWLLLQ